MQEPEHCHATDGSVFVEIPLWTQKACRRDITIKSIFIMLNAISQQFILIAVLSRATFENQELTKIKLLRKELPFQPLIPTNPANSPTMVGPLCLLPTFIPQYPCTYVTSVINTTHRYFLNCQLSSNIFDSTGVSISAFQELNFQCGAARSCIPQLRHRPAITPSWR